MIGVDTNILVRAIAKVDDTASADLARSFLSGLTAERPGFITQVVMAEFYWVISRSYRLDRESCLSVIRGLVETPTLEFDDGEGVVRALMLAEDTGADFADALVQGAVDRFGADEVVTFDRAAAQRLGWRLLTD
ncbi:PIN domain-containing protein [Microlunatus parietis]|uniref:Putative nucleic-acid-binding protein n=1 Tax=Microlunatus parietis TaxID=682979 RepID=A0A7Y9I6S3_9ACTN|nr:type II toxin-antitoxin system VapC family toxin [Microlunatus parietis]NYE71046.1 putative nucleic-acid-binding protein [Microlunatus parietis]